MITLIASLQMKNYWFNQTKLFTFLPTLSYGVQNFLNLSNTSQNTENAFVCFYICLKFT